MTQDDNAKVGFPGFVEEWNKAENRTTPEIHLKMAVWLEEKWNAPGGVKLLMMAFRGSGKSTIAALFAAWLLYTQADLRILVLAADAALAKKMVRQVKRVIERHPLAAGMKPTKLDQWAGAQFTVNRKTELRDPSMLARGISSNITGSRADIIICDDVEAPGTTGTEEKRVKLRERLSEIDFVQAPDGTQLYIGTPHTWFSIYADKPRVEAGEDKAFLDGFERLEIPVVNEAGESAWEGKFPPALIEDIREKSGPNKFASQMMLIPVSVNDGRLNPDLLKLYHEDIAYDKILDAMFIGTRRMTGVSCWWDPAFGTPRGDKSVVAVVFQDDDGNYFLQHIEYLKVVGSIAPPHDKPEEAPDSATQQCRRVAEIAKVYHMPSVSVEDNGIGKFLPIWLRNEMGRANLSCGVRALSSRASKIDRIMALDAPLSAGKIWIHKSVIETPFIQEMKEWRPMAKMRDDGLDALAGAIAQAPMKINRVYGENRKRPSWVDGGKGFVAVTAFEVR